MPQTSFEEVLDHIFTTSTTTREQGDAFENATVFFLKNDPLWKQRFTDVWLWRDAPTNTGQDTGIDVVAKDALDNTYWAIQCKCWSETASLTYKAASTFIASAQADTRYQHYMIVDTVNTWSKTLQNKTDSLNVIRVDSLALEDSDIDWHAFLHGQDASERNLYNPREHQQKAINDCINGFKEHDRGKLIMACGTGKTFTSLRLAEELNPTGFVLFLAPSISLVNQSLREWANQARLTMRPFVVCSDEKASKVSDMWTTSVRDIPYPSTTDPALLAKQVASTFSSELLSDTPDSETIPATEAPPSPPTSPDKPTSPPQPTTSNNQSGLTVIFSTYQSIDVIIEAQHLHQLPDFDLVICDEAHRTTGLLDSTKNKSSQSYFVKIHDNANVRSAKRLYMTATPKIYGTSAKKRAREESFEIASMDDEQQYGPLFHILTFGEAVDKNLLTDYRVVVMTVTEDMISSAYQSAQFAEEGELKITEAGKMVGFWKGLSERTLPTTLKNLTITEAGKTSTYTDQSPLRHAVAFTDTIANSKLLKGNFERIVGSYIENTGDKTRLRAKIDHIDGTMNSNQRKQLLNWLGSKDSDENTCHVLSNARCLSEGIDVPNLDAVIFMKPRNSQIDIIQAVGRVMRRAEGKDFGYIILPVFVPAGMHPEDALDSSDAYKAVWQILQALRSHDERLEAQINALSFEYTEVVQVKTLDESKLKRKDQAEITTEVITNEGSVSYTNINDNETDESSKTTRNPQLEFALSYSSTAALDRSIHAQIVKRVGTKVYWPDWAEDVANIAKRHIDSITHIITTSKAAAIEFERFLTGLRDSLNPSITSTDAIEMLAQHIITLPVFESLFAGVGFAQSNPVSIAMEQMVSVLETLDYGDKTDRNALSDLYYSVQTRAEAIQSDSGRQRIIKELYENFFSKAFKATSEKMGIVYTPNEVVDYMLHATDQMLRKEFGIGMEDDGVHILDPFTGTGTFIVNLIQSALISDNKLRSKYLNELHANEILLLAYYIATINIEHAYHQRMPEEYVPFPGAVMTDTFQMAENEDRPDIEVFINNSERMLAQGELPITVIIGNPPYSAGQRSANDNNQI